MQNQIEAYKDSYDDPVLIRRVASEENDTKSQGENGILFKVQKMNLLGHDQDRGPSAADHHGVAQAHCLPCYHHQIQVVLVPRTL